MSAFSCPHCGGEIVAEVTLHGKKEEPKSAAWRAERWLKEAPREVQTFVADMETAGIMDCLKSVVAQRAGGSKPNNWARFLVNIAGRLEPYRVPAPIMDRIREHFGPDVSLWQSNGIVAVVQDRVLAAMTAIETMKEIRPAAARFDFSDSWIKTRFGYVVTPLLFEEFRRRGLGAWDRVTGPAA